MGVSRRRFLLFPLSLALVVTAGNGVAQRHKRFPLRPRPDSGGQFLVSVWGPNLQATRLWVSKLDYFAACRSPVRHMRLVCDQGPVSAAEILAGALEQGRTRCQ
jgi:hypothetical protein